MSVDLSTDRQGRATFTRSWLLELKQNIWQMPLQSQHKMLPSVVHQDWPAVCLILAFRWS